MASEVRSVVPTVVGNRGLIQASEIPSDRAHTSSLMERRQVLDQDVMPEVSLRIPPDRVHVVDVSLRVVVLREESRTLQPVVVRLPALRAAGPCKVDVCQLLAGELLCFPFGELLGDAPDENIEDGAKEFSLISGHGGCWKPLGGSCQANLLVVLGLGAGLRLCTLVQGADQVCQPLVAELPSPNVG